MSRSPEAADAARCAKYFKALGDPVRLQMMRALQMGPLSVSDLSLLLEMEIANVSHHLRVLYNAGLVTTEREGKFIYYSLCKEVLRSSPRLNGLLDFGCCKLEFRPNS